MKLDGITTFVAVANTGSISEAAHRLHSSKSVVSDRLSELGRSLGVTLAYRSTRNLTSTEDGLAFLERASRIAQEIDDAATDMAQRRGALVAPLKVAVEPYDQVVAASRTPSSSFVSSRLERL